MTLTAKAAAGSGLLSTHDHALVLVDFQSQMSFAAKSIDTGVLRNNAGLITRAATGFKVPVLLTTAAEKTFSGPTFPEITDALPGQKIFDRTNMNLWEDEDVIAEINRFGKRRLVFAGLWTSVCIVDPVLSAIEQGFEAYVIADACGDMTPEAHERAMQRMIQVGARPMTSVQYLLELQRDWARVETYGLTTGIAKTHAGTYGLGIIYSQSLRDGQH